MVESDPNICFTTLALGKRHVFHAQQLAKDLEHHLPQCSFLVLTSRPNAFEAHPNVTAFYHRQESVFRCFHDKRFLIEHALSKAETCIVIDANIRILSSVDQRFDRDLFPGINGAHLYTIQSKWDSDEANQEFETSRAQRVLNREKQIVSKVLSELDLCPSEVKFPQEYLYAIKSNHNQSQIRTWIEAWASLAHYFDFHRLPWSEGFGIGIAAAIADIPIECVRILPDSSYYKERTHIFNLKTFRNPVTPEQERCHEQQKSIDRKLSSRLPRCQKYLTRLKRLSRYSMFRLRHWDDQTWIKNIKRLRSELELGADRLINLDGIPPWEV